MVVLTHWGTQYTHRPEASQRTAARAFAEAGADLVVGGHPHWVQGWERFGDTTVVHSLGNFVFDMDFQTKTREGVFLEVVLWGDQVKAIEPVPVRDRERLRPAAGHRRPRGADPARRLEHRPRPVRATLTPRRAGRHHPRDRAEPT